MVPPCMVSNFIWSLILCLFSNLTNLLGLVLLENLLYQEQLYKSNFPNVKSRSLLAIFPLLLATTRCVAIHPIHLKWWSSDVSEILPLFCIPWFYNYLHFVDFERNKKWYIDTMYWKEWIYKLTGSFACYLFRA